ncbi:PREDICTED: iron-sulfur cluster co-chaperone protein HscB, mitochondrial isoform X1 [Polistes canadensis]|uniref:iron-sulfur cluster co-chaperone protein HscB, mitochondrial isoform X1 n=2 Tax=Polistes canadensis TaxID=91411 RepID=UPI000718C575|nr:PREDICTED: iron-sulfur cluster co-chaperone protein HscB, mitochondrial isoform X1 [Polistes canadensis]
MFMSKVVRPIVNKNSVFSHLLKERRKLYFYSTHKVTNNPTISLSTLQYSSDSPSKCWNCNFLYKSELFCSQCKTLQEMPENLNYFDILGVKLDYNVNNDEVHEKYTQLQKMLHPDRFGNRMEREQRISESLSSLLNKAYSTLTNPLKRGLYMLQLKGISIPEETTSINPEFLMEIMERNEEIESALNDKEKVVRLMQENKIILHKLSKKVADSFRNNNLEQAKEVLVKMKYYANIENKLKTLKQDLGIVD